MKKTLAVLLLLATLPALATQVYRWTDAEGNVVFGGEPPEGVQAEPVTIRPPQTFKATPLPEPSVQTQPEKDTEPKKVAYESVEILRPANDEAIRSNNGLLVISFRSVPNLAEGDHFEVIMDGQPVGQTRGQSLTLENVDRGTHSLEVRVLDDAGNERAKSAPVTFHLLRHHI